MRRATTLFAIGVLGLFVAGSASAGYIEVVYDLTGSTLTTTAGGWTDPDPLTGLLTFRYGAATASAPLTSARVMSGTQHITINNVPFGFFTITGVTDTVLLPPPGGSPATLTGLTLRGTGTVTAPTTQTGLIVVADSSTTGYIHCMSAGWCAIAGITPASVQLPQSQSGPFNLPQLVFTGSTAGVGNFTGAFTMTSATPAAVLAFSYVGSEVSRVFVVPEPATSSMAALGLLGLAVLNWYTRKQRR